jgi:hypothetical protein
LVEKVAAILASKGLVPGFCYEGRWFPTFFEKGTADLEQKLCETWARRLERYENSDDQLADVGQLDARETFKASRRASLASENFCRAVVRDVVRGLGVSAKKASDVLPAASTLIRDRQMHDLGSFAAERLQFGPKFRATVDDLYRAYVEWHRAAGLLPPRPFSKKAFSQVLRGSIGVTSFKPAGPGRRRGFRGIGLLPQVGRPGEGAKRADADFLSSLRSSLDSGEFAARLERAREAVKGRYARLPVPDLAGSG